MQAFQVTESGAPLRVSNSARTGRLFFLEVSQNCVRSMNSDGTNRRTIVTDCRIPDGIVVDVEDGHIYWTNMGVPKLNDGSIERADLDGSTSPATGCS